MRELFGVIANEWMKLLRRKRLWVAGGLMVLTVGLFAVIAYENHKSALSNTPQQQLTQNEQILHSLQADSANAKANAQIIEQLKQQIASLKAEIAAEQPGANWRKPLVQAKQATEKQMAQIPAAARAHSAQWHSDQGQLMTLNYQLQHDVRPLASSWPSGYQTLMQYLSIAVRLFLPLIVVILVADMVAGEATDGTMKLLLVRPVSRTKILIGKWITSLTAAVLASAITVGALWGVALAILGSAGGTQPQAVGVQYFLQSTALDPSSGSVGPGSGQELVANYAHAAVISTTAYTWVALLLTAFSMAVVATIAFLCSTVFRSAMASTGVALGVTIVGFVLSEIAVHVKWVVRLFFPVHLALFDNWSGALSRQAQMPVSLSLGIWVLTLWAVVSLAVSIIYFARKDVLNA